MDAQMLTEMAAGSATVREFLNGAKATAERIEHLRSRFYLWHSALEDAEKKAKAAQANLAELESSYNRMKSELAAQMAPLKRKMEEDAKRIAELRVEAEKKSREAAEKLDRATALLAQAETAADRKAEPAGGRRSK